MRIHKEGQLRKAPSQQLGLRSLWKSCGYNQLDVRQDCWIALARAVQNCPLGSCGQMLIGRRGKGVSCELLIAGSGSVVMYKAAV